MTNEPLAEEAGADVVGPLLRRLERTGWFGVVLGASLAIWHADVWAAAVLTLTWAVAIVWLRSLAAQVRSLHPDNASSSRRLVALRLAALGLGLLLLFRLGLSRPLAMSYGLCLVPTALLLETARQLLFPTES